jgi:hypothetical protein
MVERPLLTPNLTEQEFGRWYWTLAELQSFARSVGVPASGVKPDVSARIAAHLSGRPAPSSPARVADTPQLAGPLDRTTVIPAGQKSTRHLREFFEREIGPSFRFDGHMRPFLKHSNGATLGDAIEHWYSTRDVPLPRQSASLEFNAFTKEWHRHHPTGSADDCRAAWQRYRSLPVDQRPPVREA